MLVGASTSLVGSDVSVASVKQVCYVDAVAVAASAVVTAALLASLCNFTVRQNIILRQVKRQLYVTRKDRQRQRKSEKEREKTCCLSSCLFLYFVTVFISVLTMIVTRVMISLLTDRPYCIITKSEGGRQREELEYFN